MHESLPHGCYRSDSWVRQAVVRVRLMKCRLTIGPQEGLTAIASRLLVKTNYACGTVRYFEPSCHETDMHNVKTSEMMLIDGTERFNYWPCKSKCTWYLVYGDDQKHCKQTAEDCRQFRNGLSPQSYHKNHLSGIRTIIISSRAYCDIRRALGS